MSKIAEKIKKLIAHADGTSNQLEAEAFMSKVHDLLQAHGMTMLDLGTLGEDAVGVDVDAISTSATYCWMNSIASALGEYYGCKLVMMKGYKNDVLWTIAGRESARVTFTLMLPYVQRQVQALGLEAYRAGVYNSRLKSVSRIGNAVAFRIWAMNREAAAATEAARKAAQADGRSTAAYATTGVNALVPVDIIEAAIAAKFPNLRKGRATKLTTDNYARDAAKKVNLNSQVNRTNTKQIGSK